MNDFPGFTGDLHTFLSELEANNRKEWWEKQKDRYERSVREPALALIEAMAPRMAKISPHVLAEAKKVGGSLMRPFRDTRFSKDKTPYKTNLGIQFRHTAGKDVHAPGFYFHVAPDGVFVGVGMWHPDPDALGAVREALAEKPAAWLAVRDAPAFRARYDLRGESLSRVPRGTAADHPLAEDLKRKDHIAVADLEPAWVLGKDLPDRLADLFASARDYMAFLAGALRLPF